MRVSANAMVTVLCLSLMLSTAGCGARIKTAADVAAIFSGRANTLDGVMVSLCQKLRGRSEMPNMSLTSLSDSECAEGGKGADNYRSVRDKFYFEGLESQVAKEAGKDVLHIRTRAKVWLNHNIINMALKITRSVKARNEGGEDPFSKPPPGNSGDKLAKLLPIKTTELERVKFNSATRSFAGKINIKGEGVATLNNDIHILGQIMDDSIAISINSPGQADFKTSLLRDVNAIAIITPFANDVYLDMTFEINVHSIGIKDVITSKIESALGSSLKRVLDLLLSVDAYSLDDSGTAGVGVR